MTIINMATTLLGSSSIKVTFRLFQLTRFTERNSVHVLKGLYSTEVSTGHSEDVPPTQDVEIVIPQRIPRGPTDILKALASTVGKDYTAPHYKYHDDPFFIPSSNIAKRSYALSKESGRRAARYFLENYPDCFQNNPADPVIKDFLAPKKYDETTGVTVEDLDECIQTASVKNAITVYENLKRNGVDIDGEIEQSLLELLCFYNCNDPAAEEYVEERWFRQNSPTMSRKTWKESGMAETLFKSMENKDSRAYCAMIQGMAKHFQVDRAYQLFEEMQIKQLPANVETYNGLLSIVPYLRQGSEPRWTFVQELLTAMNREGIAPNIKTMNRILEVLSNFSYWRPTKSIALKTISEMKRLGIEPSLATYYYLLLIFCRDKGVVCPILYEIMDDIENKTFKIQDPKDVFFFVTAMDVCHSYLMDKQLAYRVHDFLQKNYALIGDSFKESIYYQHFFKLICGTESIDVFFEFYNKYVPNVYTPEPSVMVEIIQAIEVNDALHYLPQIWSDVIVFDQVGREKIVGEILSIMARSQQPEELQSKFLTIAWDVLERIDAQLSKTKLRVQLQWTGPMLSDILTICMNSRDLEKAWMIMYKIRTEQENIIGVPEENCLERFCEECLKAQYPDRAIFCLQYCLEIGYTNVALFMKENADKYPMTEAIRSKIDSMLDSVTLVDPQNSKNKQLEE